jgi:hypothetical protein
MHAAAPAKAKDTYRNYAEPARDTVREFYRQNHMHQTHDFVVAKKGPRRAEAVLRGPAGEVPAGDAAVLTGPPRRAARCTQRKTTVFCPFRNTRCSRWPRTARASAWHSTSRPSATRSSARMLYSTRATSCSMIGPSSRTPVT